VDRDANPTLAEYRSSRRIRFVTDHFALGRRSRTGVVGLFVGFSIQSAHMLFVARKRGYLSTSEHRMAIAETALGVASWAGAAALLGPARFLIACVLPLVVANTVVMAFIVTNHSLSPLTEIQDPLVNTLSVTVPRWLDWLTLRFGLHVEHHVFPSMSSRHAPQLRQILRERWPDRYQSMSLGQALVRLHRTARVYENETTLIDPRTGQRFQTLLPRERSGPSRPEPAVESMCQEAPRLPLAG